MFSKLVRLSESSHSIFTPHWISPLRVIFIGHFSSLLAFIYFFFTENHSSNGIIFFFHPQYSADKSNTIFNFKKPNELTWIMQTTDIKWGPYQMYVIEWPLQSVSVICTHQKQHLFWVNTPKWPVALPLPRRSLGVGVCVCVCIGCSVDPCQIWFGCPRHHARAICKCKRGRTGRPSSFT